MKYHDSIKQASSIMALAVSQLEEWGLAVNPINYAVSYEYCKNSKPILTASVKRLLLSNRSVDSFFMEQMYKEHLLEQSKFRDEIISDLSQLLTQTQHSFVQSTTGAQTFIEQLDDNIPALISNNREEVKSAISQLLQASTAFKKNQQQLVEQLAQSQLKTQALADELDEVRQEIYLDPVTSLHNRKAMHKHIDAWYSEEADRRIGVIVIHVEHYSQFSERFGGLISGVILSKIAKKVASYVDNSGLPVRSAGDEFIVLLPDVDNDIANEIAAKIKQGVEKLRFVSVQSGVRLPKMSITCGISEMNSKASLEQSLNKGRKAMNSDK